MDSIPKAKALFVYYDDRLGTLMIHFADGSTMTHDDFIATCATPIASNAVECVVLAGNGCVTESPCNSAAVSAQADSLLVFGTARLGCGCYTCLCTAGRPPASDFFGRKFVAELNARERVDGPLTGLLEYLEGKSSALTVEVHDVLTVPEETTRVQMFEVVKHVGSKTAGLQRESVLGRPRCNPLFRRVMGGFDDERVQGQMGTRREDGDLVFEGGAFVRGSGPSASAEIEGKGKGKPFTTGDVVRVAEALKEAGQLLAPFDDARKKKWFRELARFSRVAEVEAARWHATPSTLQVLLGEVLFRGLMQNADQAKVCDVFCAALGGASATGVGCGITGTAVHVDTSGGTGACLPAGTGPHL
jgi:hypothetical protein